MKKTLMNYIFLLMMMGSVENSGIVRAPKAAFRKQNSLSEDCDYFDGVTTLMLADSHYTGINTKITAAQAKITACRDAIIAQGTGEGTATEKNLAAYNMQSLMSGLLAEVQAVGDANPANAILNYEAIDLTWRTRKTHERDVLEVYNGEKSGSFDLMIRPPEGTFAVVFFFTNDPENEESWKLADYNYKSTGYIENLKPGLYYYFKAQWKSTIDGESEWTQTIKFMCL